MQRMLPLLCLSLLASRLTAAGIDWSLDLEERVLADDNVLRLSDSEMDRLDADPGFQTDVEGAAALKFEHRVHAGYNLPLHSKEGLAAWLQKVTGSRAGRGRLEFDWYGKLVQYESSSANGYSSSQLIAGWRPRAGWGVDFSYLYLDNFYLRQFNDRDTGETRGCTFDSNQFRLRARARANDFGPWLQRPGLELSWMLEDTWYNEWFTEYDTESWSLGAEFSWRMPADVDVAVEYRYTVNDNVGYDPTRITPILPGEDDEGGDGSNEEDRYNLSLGYDLPLSWWKRELPLGLDFTLRDRWYQSEMTELDDPLHSGRHDRRYLLAFSARWDVLDQLSVTPMIEREWRVTEGPYEGLAELKDFYVLRWGLALRYRLH